MSYFARPSYYINKLSTADSLLYSLVSLPFCYSSEDRYYWTVGQADRRLLFSEDVSANLSMAALSGDSGLIGDLEKGLELTNKVLGVLSGDIVELDGIIQYGMSTYG